MSPSPDAVIPANYLDPGAAINIKAWGRISTTSTPTWTMGIYYGGIAGVALVTTTAMVAMNNSSNQTWTAEFDGICATEGTSGTFVMAGRVTGIVSTAAVSNAPIQGLRQTITIDTTASKAIVLGVACQNNVAGNSIVCDGWVVTG